MIFNHTDRAAKQEPGAVAPGRSNGRILLVDDEEIILMSVMKVLRILGYEVVTTGDGQEAVAAFSRNPEGFDLVITDMTMPGMTGIELAGKLMEIRADIPVLLCSGYSDSLDEQRVRDLGIRGLLEKPADIDELAKAIRQAMGRESGDAGEGFA